MLWLGSLRYSRRSFEKSRWQIQLKWLMEAYQFFPNKDNFFICLNPEKWKNRSLINLPAIMNSGNKSRSGKSEDEIREKLGTELSEFKKIRKKYLLYEDFE